MYTYEDLSVRRLHYTTANLCTFQPHNSHPLQRSLAYAANGGHARMEGALRSQADASVDNEDNGEENGWI